jgi:uncharacterized protein (TIGR00369 family)
MLQMDTGQLNEFFSGAFDGERTYRVEHVDDHGLRARQPVESLMLRPGGTVSGPTLMALADAAAYALILAHIGPVELAVTSSLNIAFLRKPQPADVIAEATFLKLGRKLAVVDVRLYSDGGVEPLAQATVTYAIPSGSPWAADAPAAG